eukprot:TRINITY_DN7208_c0_g1_i1.p1 TRINITY_DN7208_c0_g1~~TRINITY_DN7208_c0_g1_i1.p1  ORF type:complete len:396 (-),score=81.04 TRINITY_DN7208_c0_g1_i1:592-1779(-)
MNNDTEKSLVSEYRCIHESLQSKFKFLQQDESMMRMLDNLALLLYSWEICKSMISSSSSDFDQKSYSSKAITKKTFNDNTKSKNVYDILFDAYRALIHQKPMNQLETIAAYDLCIVIYSLSSLTFFEEILQYTVQNLNNPDVKLYHINQPTITRNNSEPVKNTHVNTNTTTVVPTKVTNPPNSTSSVAPTSLAQRTFTSKFTAAEEKNENELLHQQIEFFNVQIHQIEQEKDDALKQIERLKSLLESSKNGKSITEISNSFISQIDKLKMKHRQKRDDLIAQLKEAVTENTQLKNEIVNYKEKNSSLPPSPKKTANHSIRSQKKSDEVTLEELKLLTNQLTESLRANDELSSKNAELTEKFNYLTEQLSEITRIHSIIQEELHKINFFDLKKNKM